MNGPRVTRIVVVEDEPKILQNIVKKIMMCGSDYSVVATARNGVDALLRIEENEPDVLITDIVMPMLDGLALLREVGNSYPHMHVVIVSGHDDFDYAKRALQYGVDDYLLKPLKMEVLRETLTKIRDRLMSDAHEATRDQLFRLVHGTAATGESSSVQIRTQVVLACIGNVHLLSSDEVIDEETQEFLKRGWVAFAGCVDEWRKPYSGRWWLIDGGAPNQRFLLLEATSDADALERTAVESLHLVLGETFNSSAVKVAYSLETIGASGIHSVVGRTLRALHANTMIGDAQLIDADLTAKPIAPHVGDARNDLERLRITALGDRDSLEAETRAVLTDWVRDCPNQTSLLGRIRELWEMVCPESEHGAVSRRVIEDCVASAVVRHSGSAEFVAAIARGIASHVQERETLLTPRRLVSLLEEYLMGNYKRQIDFARTSEIFGYSVSYLSRIFRRIKGIPPVRYLVDLRIERAQQLLIQRPELSIREVGASVGFQDQHYFSRVFRKRTGQTPSEFKEHATVLCSTQTRHATPGTSRTSPGIADEDRAAGQGRASAEATDRRRTD